jgi:hypothetical protein
VTRERERERGLLLVGERERERERERPSFGGWWGERDSRLVVDVFFFSFVLLLPRWMQYGVYINRRCAGGRGGREEEEGYGGARLIKQTF